MNHKPNSTELARYHVFNSLNASLRRLQLEYMDIFYVHGVDPAAALEEIVKSLNEIVSSGKIKLCFHLKLTGLEGRQSTGNC